MDGFIIFMAMVIALTIGGMMGGKFTRGSIKQNDNGIIIHAKDTVPRVCYIARNKEIYFPCEKYDAIKSEMRDE